MQPIYKTVKELQQIKLDLQNEQTNILQMQMKCKTKTEFNKCEMLLTSIDKCFARWKMQTLRAVINY